MYLSSSVKRTSRKMKYPECKLASILNPGKYCVVSTDKEHVSEVKILEENMRKEMRSDDTSECQLSCQMYVAVEDFTGELRRGIIEKKLRQDLYQVLLIDYGRVIQIQKSYIRVITNKDFIEVEPLAFVVRLYGLVPIKNVEMEEIKKPRATSDWVPEALKFVQNFFRDNCKVIVKSSLIQKRTVYGDLFIKPQSQMKFISLRKLLCTHKFCAYSESNFLRLEGLSSFSKSSETKTKMQLVEKWQRENFGEVESNCDTNSAKFSCPNPSTIGTSCNSLNQDNNTSSIGDNPGPSTDLLKKFGLGRGKLKLLIAEMKRKESTTTGKQQSSFLKNTDVEREHEKTSDYDHCGMSGKGRSIAKPDGFREIIDELGEVSPPAKDVFPLRTLKKKKENTVQSLNLPIETKKRTPKSNESETSLGSSHSKGSSIKRNMQAWKQPLKGMKSFSCWAPYVSFNDTTVEPVNTFKELPIPHTIIQNLEKGGAFRDLSQIQRWAIPAIRKQLNTVIIGSSKTGKTTSYVVPLIDYVQDSTFFEELPYGNGPAVVIVASSSRVCESVYYMCHSLLGNIINNRIKKSDIKIVLAHGNGCEKEVWVDLTNGCDILISTPHCLVRLLEHTILTNFERLSCLVLDEIDVISQNPFRKKVRVILEKAKFATKNRHYQTIITGERWTHNVESLVKTFVESYALIIGSSAEAVIFKKLKPNIHLVDRNHKLETLLNLLEDTIKTSKTLVICEKAAEANRLNYFLAEKGITSLLAHERVTSDRLKGVKSCWKMSPGSPLIVTDGVINELNIREAQTLVHFELPSKSKTNFYLRYTTLSGFRGIGTSENAKTEDLNLRSIILIDDENHRQLPHIIDFVARLGAKIPSKILGKCEEIRRVSEVEKSETPICTNLLSLGHCRNTKDCPQRHALVKTLDSPKNVPTSGWVNFVILKTHDASCFYVKLLEHIDLEGRSFKMEDRRLDLSTKIADFFKNKNNQRVLGVAKFGDVCAVKGGVEDKEIFYRAKIIEVLRVDKYGKALEVNVKLMDEGDIWKRKKTELFELPTDISNHPPTAVDVWVVGIQPMDFDVVWSGIANEFVSNLMTKKLQNNQYWSGKIVLALDNTLFLEPIKRKEFLPLLKTHVFDLAVQGELFNKRIAVPNNEHLPALLKLCAAGGIDVPGKEEQKKDLITVQPQWAFFDSDFIRVTFLAAESTSAVFLQPKKFDKVLQELEEDCQKEAKAQKTKKLKPDKITVGMFCLALFEEGTWNRARVESENETQFQVFFIDHGDFLFVPKANVIPIPQTLLLRLPCQAIECCLVGIQSEEECPVEVLQEIYSFSDNGKEDLYAYIVDKNLAPSVTGGRKYKINLLNLTGISLNKILIDEELVRGEETEKKYVEDIEILDSDSEEEEEKDEEIPGKKEFWESHFNNLNDDIFESEETLEFLKEFASKFLTDAIPPQNNSAVTPKEEPHQSLQKQPEVRSITQTSPDLENQSRKSSDMKLKLKTKENVLTPQILWCQNQLEVQIKIMLGNVQDYSLECTTHNISFRCFIKEKFYAVDLKLFGAINPRMTKITIKGLHVVLVLTKLAFPLWSRLHADEGKHRWINLDVESLVDKEGIFYDRIQSAKLAIESGLIKEGITTNDIRAYSDSDEDEVSFDELEENMDLD